MKILANGEIVADDDPRAQQTPNNASQSRPPRSNVSSTPSQSNPDSSSSWSFGLGNPAADGGAGGGRGGIGTPSNNGVGGGGRGDNNDAVQTESVTVFDLVNARMLEAGFPRLNLGPYSVDPIAVVGTCLALMLFGLPGLVLSLGLFLAVKFSNHGIPSIADFTGGGEGGARGGTGRVAQRSQRSEARRDLMDERGDGSPDGHPQRRNPEEEKWGKGQRLGGR